MNTSAFSSSDQARQVSLFLAVILSLVTLSGCKHVSNLEGDYTITATHSALPLGHESSFAGTPGKVVQVDELIDSNAEVVWTFEPADEEHYIISSKSTGLVLSASNSEDLKQLTLNTPNNSDEQLFKVISSVHIPNGHYALINKATGLAATVLNSGVGNGAAIVESQLFFQKNQLWVLSQYEPELPDRELVSTEDAWDVFAEAGQPYKGPRYQQDFDNHHIQEASPLDPRKVAPGTMIPGRVIVDGKPFVEYYPGTLPFIAVCIHNKRSATAQMRRDYPVGWRTCNKNCNSVNASIAFRDGKSNLTPGDSGSGELCKRTVDYLEQITGQRPHMIVPNWPKGLMDMNRRPRNKVAHVNPPLRQHPDLLATWDDFMSFVREARDIAYQDWGGGLQIGFHGQISRSARNHLGTGLTAGNLNTTEAVMNNPNSRQYKTIMNSSRLMYSLHQLKLSPWEAYKGQYSIGQGIAIRGIPTFPSATMRDQKGPFWSTGGSFERTSTSNDFQDRKIAGRPYPNHHPLHFDNIQLESYSNFMRGNRLPVYAAQLGEAIYDNLVYNMGFDIPRISKGINAMTQDELAPIATAAADCKGSPIASSTRYRTDDHFHTPQACLRFCRETDGCNYVSMFVDPSPDPNNKKYRSTRECFAYRTCEIEPRSHYNVYER